MSRNNSRRRTSSRKGRVPERKDAGPLPKVEDVPAVLRKEKPNSSYELLIQKAVSEGRIGGKEKCPVCGMSYNTKSEAQSCCDKILSTGRL